MGRAYVLGSALANENIYSATIAKPKVSAELMYRRLGHLSHSTLQGIDTVTTGLLGPIQRMEGHCPGYTLSKAIKVTNRT